MPFVDAVRFDCLEKRMIDLRAEIRLRGSQCHCDKMTVIMLYYDLQIV
ncbi:hypothetical protein CA85_20070 [Allorhodopirellula solitaria]|uniref:Uncharacterized protein n=1 Tax=Allorhodopirellula solitaria TaxID=2527987 RepID=A0A5C5XWU5_9BACT|nr:hypothetical protein CA85_20070 [Allorhodopirellula solitaria]